MPKTFFFYDLETSGVNPRSGRIMQFAGRRTDMDLNLIGEPVNELIELSEDVLPSPEALFITGITPAKTRDEGWREADFAKKAYEEIFTPDTIAVGFNSIRFDDEFMRHFFWRNFYDPYEWSWKDGRSRWDLLDVVRMVRALRPEGIEWPVRDDGVATNRLELLTKLNGIEHLQAHDAMSDVDALIAVTKLIKNRQPQMYQYLLDLRDKKKVQALVNLDDKKPFVYTSGRYDAEFDKTTVAFPLAPARNGNVAVYDLRYDPTPLLEMSAKELAANMFATREQREKPDFVRVPVKELAYNKVPAVAPLGVLQQSDGWTRLKLSVETVEKHKKILLSASQVAENIRSIYEKAPEFKKSQYPEEQLYDGFLNDRDKVRTQAVRNASEDELADFHPEFDDERLSSLLLHYKARNFPRTLSEAEMVKWEAWRAGKLQQEMPAYMQRLSTLAATASSEQEFILQELQLWAESIYPADV